MSTQVEGHHILFGANKAPIKYKGQLNNNDVAYAGTEGYDRHRVFKIRSFKGDRGLLEEQPHSRGLVLNDCMILYFKEGIGWCYRNEDFIVGGFKWLKGTKPVRVKGI